ncbi:glycoside hydrolase family 13 protein [Dentipellis sp. KUC8613]|nr:glycoside hydrolase family 13 protein [Dentipellis sp. KUC8613]
MSAVSKISPQHTRAWWKEAVVYQIYPASFADSNSDGVGDLNGIISKLDYLKDLGVNVLWLSPIYRSPQADMGYDIADYEDIDPRYGTLGDWDNLLKGAHERGMKLMMDLVVNHTSDEHDWFIQSKSSKQNPKRDWYIWRPPRYDENGNRKPPNNWKSIFEGSAWQYDEATDEYYLHLYLDKQPDLNWDNPEVREAVFSLMNFWLSRGCDGFRMDVINLISKVEGLPDVPVTDPTQEYQMASPMYVNGPHVHEYIKEMNLRVLSKYDLITVGEAPFTYTTTGLAAFVLPANLELNMVFQFQVVEIDNSDEGVEGSAPLKYREWQLPELKAIINKWQNLLLDDGFWNAVFIENHDQARSVSRYGDDSPKWRSASAKLIAMMQITQAGTLYVYQGEEIGTKNFAGWPIEEYKDVATQNYYKRVLKERRAEQGKEDVDMSDVLYGCQRKARDHARTPVQWDASPHGGFTDGTPWMRVNDDYKEWNVAVELKDPGSVLAFWKQALSVRKQNDVLIYGDYHLLSPDDEKVFAYTRSLGSSSVLVLLNFGADEVQYSIEEVPQFVGAQLLLGNYEDGTQEHATEKTKLRGWEGKIFIR